MSRLQRLRYSAPGTATIQHSAPVSVDVLFPRRQHHPVWSPPSCIHPHSVLIHRNISSDYALYRPILCSAETARVEMGQNLLVSFSDSIQTQTTLTSRYECNIRINRVKRQTFKQNAMLGVIPVMSFSRQTPRTYSDQTTQYCSHHIMSYCSFTWTYTIQKFKEQFGIYNHGS